MEVDNLLADAEKLTGGKVTVEGVCHHERTCHSAL